jgi:hypothetical protein
VRISSIFKRFKLLNDDVPGSRGALKYDPERAKKPETMAGLKAKFRCHIKSCGLE